MQKQIRKHSINSSSRHHLTILGSGTSTGVPMLGCECSVCKSKDPKDQRLRTSIYIKSKKGRRILVDTTPDLRTQFLNNAIKEVDFVILTHEHADHTHGLDDLRPLAFYHKNPLPLYTNAHTSQQMTERFPYVFRPYNKKIIGGGIPKLQLITLNPPCSKSIQGEKLRFFHLPHGYTQTIAFIHGKLGYIVDCQQVDEKTLQVFKRAKLDLLIIDCVRRRPHETHLWLERTIEYANTIQAKRTGFTHLSHTFQHANFTDELKKINKSYFPVYDGQTFYYS